MELIQQQADPTCSSYSLNQIFLRQNIREKHSEIELAAIISTDFSIVEKERGELASF